MTKAKRGSYHHGDLAEALLGAADDLVAEKGAAGFSLREAARAVGVDPAAVYRHFRDREDLLHALARRGFGRLATHMEEAILKQGPRSPARALRVIGLSYVTFAVENPSQFRAMFGPNGVPARDPRLRGDYVKGRAPYDILEQTVVAWSKTTKLRTDVNGACTVLWAGVHGIALLFIDGALRPESAKAREETVDTIVSTMVAGLVKA